MLRLESEEFLPTAQNLKDCIFQEVGDSVSLVVAKCGKVFHAVWPDFCHGSGSSDWVPRTKRLEQRCHPFEDKILVAAKLCLSLIEDSFLRRKMSEGSTQRRADDLDWGLSHVFERAWSLFYFSKG